MRIWNVVTARSATLEGHTQWVNCLATLDGGRLASGSDDKSIIVWNLADGKKLATLEGDEKGVNCLAALDGDRLASGGGDKSVKHLSLRFWRSTLGSSYIQLKIVSGQ